METASLEGKYNHCDTSSDQWKSMRTRCVYYFLLLRADYSPGFAGGVKTLEVLRCSGEQSIYRNITEVKTHHKNFYCCGWSTAHKEGSMPLKQQQTTECAR